MKPISAQLSESRLRRSPVGAVERLDGGAGGIARLPRALVSCMVGGVSHVVVDQSPLQGLPRQPP